MGYCNNKGMYNSNETISSKNNIISADLSAFSLINSIFLFFFPSLSFSHSLS